MDFAAATVTVRQRADKWCAIGSPKAAASRRTIPVPPMVVNTLREWMLACLRRDTGKKDANGEPIKELHFVFPNGNGKVELLPNSSRRHWHPLQIEAGVAVPTLDDDGKPVVNEENKPVMAPKYSGLHALRHFFCSWCVARPQDGGLGLPLKTVQVRMGHGTLAMTADRYGHLFPATDDAEVFAAGERSLKSQRVHRATSRVYPPPFPLCSRSPTPGRRLATRAEMGWFLLPGHQGRQRCAALLKSGADYSNIQVCAGPSPHCRRTQQFSTANCA